MEKSVIRHRLVDYIHWNFKLHTLIQWIDSLVQIQWKQLNQLLFEVFVVAALKAVWMKRNCKIMAKCGGSIVSEVFKDTNIAEKFEWSNCGECLNACDLENSILNVIFHLHEYERAFRPLFSVVKRNALHLVNIKVKFATRLHISLRLFYIHMDHMKVVWRKRQHHGIVYVRRTRSVKERRERERKKASHYIPAKQLELMTMLYIRNRENMRL